jgi:hypothetical protein
MSAIRWNGGAGPAICLAAVSSLVGPKGDTGDYAEVGESTIANGIDTRVLFNNNGTLGEYAVSGSGKVVMTSDAIVSLVSYSALTALSASVGERYYLRQYQASPAAVGGGSFLALSGQGFFGLPTITDGGSGYSNGTHTVNLAGGGGSGATVSAIVESGKVTRVEWRTEGSGYTSAPTFTWSDIPGGGTPGTITLSLADGGVYVRSANNVVLCREEFLETGVVRPEWWGAKGIQSGDDAPALNAAFSFIRTSADFSGNTNYKLALRGQAEYNILSPVDVTRFRSFGLEVEQNGALFHVRIAGGVGFDFTNSSNISWPNFRVYGDAALVPKYGAVLAIRSTESSPWNDFANAEMFGAFTDACVYNFGSEFFTANRASFANSYSGGRAMILDPINVKGWDSPFCPSLASTNAWHSMSELRFESSRFASNGAPEAIEITGTMPHLKFIQCYGAPRDGAIVGLHQRSDAFEEFPAYCECEFDFRGEPRASVSANPITDMIKFYSDDGGVSLHGVKISDYGFDYSRSLLRNEGAGTVNIRDAEIHLGSYTNGGAVFASGGNINLDGNVACNNNTAEPVTFSGLSSLKGKLYTRASEGSITYPSNYDLWLCIAGSGWKYVSSSSNLLLPLRITLGATHVREYTTAPEGLVTAPPGSLLLRKETNDANSTLYLKISGTGNTGWRAVPSDIAALVLAASAKSTPVDGDLFPILDSAASNVLKNLTWANVKATLKTYFDTLYYIVGGTDVAVADGGTGASNARAAQANLRGWYVLAASGVAASHTGSTSETTLATVTVPAGALGANGIMRVRANWSYPNSVNTKVFRTRVGGVSGTSIASYTATTTQSIVVANQLHNRNSQSSQVCANSAWLGGAIDATPTTLSVDTSNAFDVLFTVVLANSSETAVLHSYSVEIYYAA